MGRGMIRLFLLIFIAALASTAAAQAPPRLETAAEALDQDARLYAAQHQVTQTEALRRLRVQQASAIATDRIVTEFRDRLAGISIEHSPEFRIAVLLTGTEAVPDRRLAVAGTSVPIVFQVGGKGDPRASRRRAS